MDKSKHSNEYIRAQINAGELFAKKLKEVMFPGIKTDIKIAFAVGHQMKRMKDHLRPLYDHYNDEVKFIHEIGAFSHEEIADILNDMKAREAECKTNQLKGTGTPMQVSTVMQSLK